MEEKKPNEYTPEELKKFVLRELRHQKYQQNYDHQRYLGHKTQRAAYNHEYGQTHRKERTVHDHAYRQKNKQRLATRDHLHYLKNKDKILAHCHKYYLENTETARARSARRRSRMLNAEGKFTPKEFKQKCESYKNCCVYCGQQKILGPDHAIPLIKGGSNFICNILPCCKKCNNLKGTKIFEEFLKLHTLKEQEEILMRIYAAEHVKDEKNNE